MIHVDSYPMEITMNTRTHRFTNGFNITEKTNLILKKILIIVSYTNKSNAMLFIAWHVGKPFIAVLVLYKL